MTWNWGRQVQGVQVCKLACSVAPTDHSNGRAIVVNLTVFIENKVLAVVT